MHHQLQLQIFTICILYKAEILCNYSCNQLWTHGIPAVIGSNSAATLQHTCSSKAQYYTKQRGIVCMRILCNYSCMPPLLISLHTSSTNGTQLGQDRHTSGNTSQRLDLIRKRFIKLLSVLCCAYKMLWFIIGNPPQQYSVISTLPVYKFQASVWCSLNIPGPCLPAGWAADACVACVRPANIQQIASHGTDGNMFSWEKCLVECSGEKIYLELYYVLPKLQKWQEDKLGTICRTLVNLIFRF